MLLTVIAVLLMEKMREFRPNRKKKKEQHAARRLYSLCDCRAGLVIPERSRISIGDVSNELGTHVRTNEQSQTLLVKG
jgi:hypothetical protein